MLSETSLSWRDAGTGTYPLPARTHMEPDFARSDESHSDATEVRPPSDAQVSVPQLAIASVSQRTVAASQPLAEWHGEVESMGQDSFAATLRGKIGDGVAGVVEEALIPIDDVRPDDLPLLREGAFFRLCVTYVQDRGARRRVTDVIFRRMPAYRREELEGAQESARELIRAIRLE